MKKGRERGEGGEGDRKAVKPLPGKTLAAKAPSAKAPSVKSLAAKALKAEPPGAQPSGAQPSGAQPSGAKPPSAKPLKAKAPKAKVPKAKAPKAKPLKAKPSKASPARAKAAPAPSHQLAALPWRRLDGQLQILVITSRETRRWVIPKGWPMAGRTDAEAAAQEAFEEAGLRGVIAAAPIGSFPYLKQVKGAEARPCEVAVYPLEVTEELDAWPEAGQRQREWVAPGEAAARVDEPELSRLILDFRGGATAPPVLPAPGPLMRLIRRLLR